MHISICPSFCLSLLSVPWPGLFSGLSSLVDHPNLDAMQGVLTGVMH